MSDETEIGISLNDRCNELIDEFIKKNFENLRGGLKTWLKRKVTNLVEKCIDSDCHEINV